MSSSVGRCGLAAELAALYALWCVFSSLTDTLNKRILLQFPFPVTLTVFHFAMSALAGHLALVRLKQLFTKAGDGSGSGSSKQRSGKGVGRDMLLVSACQAAGFLLTNMSFGRVAVPFTHTVKACAPVFSLFLARLLLGNRYSWLVYASLVPMVSGVGIVAASELSFDKLGLVLALGSNVCFAMRSIVSKRVMASSGIDNARLYFAMVKTALAMVFPIWLATDLRQLMDRPDVIERLGVGDDPSSSVLVLLCVCGLCHYAYNQISIMVLARVLPLTHEVLNTTRRVVLITVTTIVFGLVPSWQNIAGTATVFLGVALYIWAKQRQRQSSSAAVAVKPKQH
eukprot:TRINITY_DN103252_c0_g1_i1.p1 TRINITY_DN103252_c0_g1~~TRINITY_DN103252_c0_g1_i1.p1  ORF type:complete len:340 (-),score=130.39 TRINITY_DN103252_c0_g1_i1:76-1095(-)